MANCDSIRVDHLDLNTSGAEVDAPNGVYNATTALAYFVYADQADVFVGSALNRTHAIYFRTYNPVTQAFTAAVEVFRSGNDATGRAEYPRLVRLTDGRLICAYIYYDGTGWGVYAKESADSGVTWSAQVAAVAINAAGPAGIPPMFASDGTNVWTWVWFPGGGAGGTLIKFNKRTGVGTWGVESTVFDGDANDQMPYYEVSSGNNSSVLSSSVGLFCALHYTGGTISPTSVKMTCQRTTNGATFSQVTMKDYGTSTLQFIRGGPKVVVSTGGRINAMWLEVLAGPIYSPVVAYSDDQGATWVFVGTPAVFPVSTTEIDQEEWGFAIDASDRLYFSCHVSANAEWQIYRTDTAVSDWALLHSCTYIGKTLAAGKRTSAFFAGNFYLHAFEVIGTGPTHFELALLSEETIPPGGGGGPSAPLPSESGADENNVIIRKVLGPKSGGWSAHKKPVACWMPWDEGDADTGREVPILTGGTEAWPTIQDPALEPVINRIWAPDLYSDRRYVFNETVYDPLKVEIKTKEYQLEGVHDKNVVRAILMQYSRKGVPFTVELWVDDQIVDAYEFVETGGLPVVKFRAVKTYGNVGTVAWLRIVDESVDPLTIDSIEFVYIKKGRRGNA